MCSIKAKHFQTSLIFVRKARTYPSGDLIGVNGNTGLPKNMRVEAYDSDKRTSLLKRYINDQVIFLEFMSEN